MNQEFRSKGGKGAKIIKRVRSSKVKIQRKGSGNKTKSKQGNL